MCGICGVIGLPAATARPATGRMTRAMVHRGPDDEGFREMPLTTDPDGPVAAFGFRRLAILDLSPAGHQPMVNPATGDVLVFNGEIYNYADLRARLQVKGRVFRSSGDTEVLLHALSEWGPAALDELDGMFAFAFYQAATRRVLLARGPLGIKPLYVARIRDAIVFASEVKAVLASGLVPTELDPAGVATFLAYGAPQDPLTVHRFVRSMPAGSFEWIGRDELRGSPTGPRRYWRFPDLAPAGSAGPDPAATTRELLADAVRRQCVADVPVGVFLSAGIDSGAITALAQPQHGAVHTFTVGFDAPSARDETAGAERTAKALGTRHFRTVVTEAQAVVRFQEWLRASDRPSVDGLNTFIVSGAAKEQGMAVALSGLGADELFGGYPIFSRAARLRPLMAALGTLPPLARKALALPLFATLPKIRRRKAVEMFTRATSPMAMAIFSHRLFLDDRLRRLGMDARDLRLTDDYLPGEAYEAFAANGDAFHDVGVVELSLYMGNTLLRDSDIFSMAHSLELRVPFLGKSLVSYVCSLPQFIRAPSRAASKHLLRRGMAALLPNEVFRRAKSGFTLPVDSWMRGVLKEACDGAVEELAACPLFDAREVRNLWTTLHRERGDGQASRRLSLVALGSYLAAIRDAAPAPA